MKTEERNELITKIKTYLQTFDKLLNPQSGATDAKKNFKRAVRVKNFQSYESITKTFDQQFSAVFTANRYLGAKEEREFDEKNAVLEISNFANLILNVLSCDYYNKLLKTIENDAKSHPNFIEKLNHIEFLITEASAVVEEFADYLNLLNGKLNPNDPKLVESTNTFRQNLNTRKQKVDQVDFNQNIAVGNNTSNSEAAQSPIDFRTIVYKNNKPLTDEQESYQQAQSMMDPSPLCQVLSKEQINQLEAKQTLVIDEPIIEKSSEKSFTPEQVVVINDEASCSKKGSTPMADLDNLLLQSPLTPNSEKNVATKLAENYFSNLQQEWLKQSTSFFYGWRSAKTKQLDAAFAEALTSSEDKHVKLTKLLGAAHQWKNQEDRRFLRLSFRYKAVINLIKELENKLYLLHALEEERAAQPKIELSHIVNKVKTIVNTSAQHKQPRGFETIMHTIPVSFSVNSTSPGKRRDEKPEADVKLFRHIQDISYQRFTGHGFAFFSALTRSAKNSEFYKHIVNTDISSNESLLKLDKFLDDYMKPAP